MSNTEEKTLGETMATSLDTSSQERVGWLTAGKLILLSIISLGVIVALLSLSGEPDTLVLRDRMISFWGLFILMGIAYLMSNNRSAISLRVVISGILIQLAFALAVMKTHAGQVFFQVIGNAFSGLLAFTNKGAAFLYGEILLDSTNFSFIFAFQVLPTVIFVSSVTAVLYYFGVLQRVVGAMAWVMTKLMKISGAESLSSAVNVFVGQTEAPLFIRPYVPRMTNSELMVVMTGGFATIAGAVMAAYAIFLKQAGLATGPGHLLAASVLSAPAAIVMAKIMFPETGKPETAGSGTVNIPITDVNAIDAAARGASEGLRLAVNVGAMLLAFIAFIALFNWVVGEGLDKLLVWQGFSPLQLSLEKLFGWAFSPLAWIMGVPWKDCIQVGNLLGQKTIINEFVAYLNLAPMVKEGTISLRSQIIALYALCGFSNLSSIAIQLGGIGVLAPDRRGDLARLGLRAMIAGSLACFMTACFAGMLI